MRFLRRKSKPFTANLRRKDVCLGGNGSKIGVWEQKSAQSEPIFGDFGGILSRWLLEGGGDLGVGAEEEGDELGAAHGGDDQGHDAFHHFAVSESDCKPVG